MTIAYGVLFVLSLLMPPLYFVYIHKKQNEPWLLTLFVCVCMVNLGYLLLSLSKTVGFALFANKVTYLGQVFIPMCMFMLISKICGITYKKSLTLILIILAVIMLAIVCTTGYLDWYYVDVTLGNADGATYLIKEYGFLHPTNLVYVLAYFVAMLSIIGISLKKTRDASQKLAGFMLVIVLGNIGMWVIEKITSWNFELLSVSYVMSMLAFFFVFILLQEYILKSEISETEEKAPVIVVDSLSRGEKLQKILSVLPENVTLSPRQTDVLEGIIDGKSRKEMAADLHLSENTVKMHTSALYRVLGVTSRDELRALFKD